jgi:hypothetical protein
VSPWVAICGRGASVNEPVGARNARSNPGTFRDERKPCERLACGVAAAEHAKQRVGFDLAVEAEVGCGGAGPPAGGFTVAEVVILDARRDLGQVAVDAVHAGELADVQHPTTATGGPRTRRVQLCVLDYPVTCRGGAGRLWGEVRTAPV